jgi:hypothetical protein
MMPPFSGPPLNHLQCLWQSPDHCINNQLKEDSSPIIGGLSMKRRECVNQTGHGNVVHIEATDFDMPGLKRFGGRQQHLLRSVRLSFYSPS